MLLAAKAPASGQVKAAAPAPADLVVEDVIASILAGHQAVGRCWTSMATRLLRLCALRPSRT